MPEIALSEIPATSPTMSEVMRSCLLRAGLSRALGSSDFVLGSPRAWLGMAYHSVLEMIPDIEGQADSIDAAVSRLWANAIARQYERMKHHPLDQRFGEPKSWPGYYLAEASVRLRAGEIVTPGKRVPNRSSDSSDGPLERPAPVRERQLVAGGGKLIGKPDLIGDGEIVDYKTGEILELDGDGSSATVKAAYVRQLRLYGYLIHEVLGWWPQRGRLFPLSGPAVDVALDADECVREGMEAMGLLDRYNERVQRTSDIASLASPSSEACSWCQFKIICPAFWRAADASWSGHMDGAAVQGVLAEAAKPVHGGEAFAISLEIQGGSEVRQKSQVAPFVIATYPDIASSIVGDRVRVVGLRKRSDGRLIPGPRTVIAREVALPTITVRAESQ